MTLFNQYNFSKIISLFENQAASRGWCYGSRKFFSEIDNIGYQGYFNYSQFLNSHPCIYEEKAKILPKEIAIKIQYVWDQQFSSTINVVLGNEWNAGNLSYHLKSRPVWEGFVEREKLDQLKDYMCLDNICVGSR